MTNRSSGTTAASLKRDRPPSRLGPSQLILLGMCSRQSGAAVAEPLFDRFGAIGVASMRLVFSALFLLVTVRPSLKFSAKQFLAIAGYGLCFAGMNLSFYQALMRLPLGITVTIEFMGPLLITLAGSRRIIDLVWATLAATGVVLIGWGGSVHSAIGILFAVMAGASWAGYILLGKQFRSDSIGRHGLALGMAFGAIISIPFAVAEGHLNIWDPYTIGMGVLVAGLSSVIPYSLEFFSLRHVAAKVFGILMSVEPGIAAIIGLLFLGQAVSVSEIIAIACVVTASIGATQVAARGES